MTLRFLKVPLLVALFLAAPPALGQQPPDPQKLAAAQALFEQGQAAMDKKDYAAACPKLEEVTRILPNGVGGHLTLAQCYEGAGRLASAWTTYVFAQPVAARARRGPEEKLARSRAEALKAKLAKIVVTVPDAVRALGGLAIERDGIPVGAVQWGTPVPVDKGKHVVVATATGKPRWEKMVEVPADGVTVTVDVGGLVEAAPVVAPPAVVPPLPVPLPGDPLVVKAPVLVEPPPERVSRPPFWSGLRISGAVVAGVGSVGIGVGSAFAAMASSKNNQSKSLCGASIGSADPNFCTPTGKQARNDSLSDAGISTGVFVAGVVALAGGVTLFAVGGRRSPQATVGVGPRSIDVSGAW